MDEDKDKDSTVFIQGMRRMDISALWLEGMLTAKVSGRQVRGRPRLDWIYGVEKASYSREMTVEHTRQWARDVEE